MSKFSLDNTRYMHAVNQSYDEVLETLNDAKKLRTVLSIEKTDSASAHRNALELINQAAALTPEDDVSAMVRFKHFVKHGIEYGVEFKLCIFRADGVIENNKTVNYLIYASTNTVDLQAMVNGKDLYFAGIIKFLN